MNDSGCYPLSYIEQFAKFLTEYGITPEQLLRGTQLTPTDLVRPTGLIDEEMGGYLFTRGIQLANDPAISIKWGLRMHLTFHGVVGLAAMSCKTLRDALDIAHNYIGICRPSIALEWRVEGGFAKIIINTQITKYFDQEFRNIALAVHLIQLAKILTGLDVPHSVELKIAKPTWWNFTPGSAFARWRFGGEQSQITTPASVLDYPIISADTATSIYMRRMCDQILAETFLHSSTGARVRQILLSECPKTIDSGEVAERLGLSGSTLARKLAKENTSFRSLTEEVRSTYAAQLIRKSDRPLKEIAQLLGYHDMSNFNRAFKRWYGGISPAAYRKNDPRIESIDPINPTPTNLNQVA